MSLAKINVHFGCSLTDREFEILEMLVQGYANKEIADRLFVIMNTVRTHLKHLYSKLGVESRTRAIASIHALSTT